MKKISILFSIGVFFIVFATGCGSMKKKSQEQLAAQQEAAISGQDIPLETMPEGNFIEPSEKGITGIFEDIHFDYDKSNIKEQDYIILNRIGKWMKENERVKLMIEGHCDERGSNEYNMALGEQRALSARKYLAGLGIDADRIFTISYGEEKPADSGHAEASWLKNRRAHFLISR